MWERASSTTSGPSEHELSKPAPACSRPSLVPSSLQPWYRPPVELRSPHARPLRLRADNLTGPARTPWGGRRIIDGLKRGLGLRVEGPVGESWELSVEPDFPSGLAMPVGGAQPAGQTLTLSHLIEQAPEGFLGSDRAAEWGSTGLLVKLLDAASRLSLQIHPSGDDPSLGPGESGKQEVWVILHAQIVPCVDATSQQCRCLGCGSGGDLLRRPDVVHNRTPDERRIREQR